MPTAETIEMEVSKSDALENDGDIGHDVIVAKGCSEVSDNSRGSGRITSSLPELLKVSEFRQLYLSNPAVKISSLQHKWNRFINRKCRRACLMKCLTNTFPVWSMLQAYNVRTELLSDFVAGLSVGIVQIPSSMAFAMLASLPPICGLYTAFISAVVYFLFGTSRFVSVGTTATVSLVVGNAVENNEDNFRDFIGHPNVSRNATEFTEFSFEAHGHKVAAATALTFLVGSILVVMGKLRFGIATSYMPDPMLGGFLTSAMILVIISQLKVVLGLKITKQVQPFKCVKEVIEIGKNIASTNVASLVSSSVCFVILYLVKVCVNERFKERLPFPVPIELIILAIATAISHFTDLNGKFGLEIVGVIPSSLPAPQFPPIQKTNTGLLRDALTVAIVAYVVSVSIAKALAKKTREKINSNQEMVAVGASSLVSSMFSGFAVGVSLSRSVVQKSTGGKSQVASLVGSVVVLLVIISIGPLFHSLPISVLAAIILVAFKSVFTQLRRGKRHWDICKYDFTMWTVTFLGVLFLGVDIGLCLGVICSILSVVVRTQRSRVLGLEKVQQSSIYMPLEKYKCGIEQNWKKIVYFEGPLYFANAELFDERFRSLNPIPVTVQSGECKNAKKTETVVRFFSGKQEQYKDMPEKTSTKALPIGGEVSETAALSPELTTGISGDLQCIIVDCSGITFSDEAGISIITQLILDYKEASVSILLAGLRDDVIESIQRSGYWEQLSDQAFVTVGGAEIYAERVSRDKLG